MLIAKTQDSDSPLSNAYYSAIHFYLDNGNLKIYSGANIDPSSYELFKSRKHRNCAEKQAALVAKLDQLTNVEMRIMFLYRKRETERQFSAEKLLPCKDCYENYIQDLIDKDGHLVLIVDDNETRNFFKNPNLDSSINSVEVNGQIINYKIFNAKEMMHLNIENTLGGRVCAEGHG
jgi:cytidine deaminase